MSEAPRRREHSRTGRELGMGRALSRRAPDPGARRRGRFTGAATVPRGERMGRSRAVAGPVDRPVENPVENMSKDRGARPGADSSTFYRQVFHSLIDRSGSTSSRGVGLRRPLSVAVFGVEEELAAEFSTPLLLLFFISISCFVVVGEAPGGPKG